jgi:hypothetical protein
MLSAMSLNVLPRDFATRPIAQSSSLTPRIALRHISKPSVLEIRLRRLSAARTFGARVESRPCATFFAEPMTSVHQSSSSALTSAASGESSDTAASLISFVTSRRSRRTSRSLAA